MDPTFERKDDDVGRDADITAAAAAESERERLRTAGIGMRRMAPISSDEVMNCIRNVRETISVDPGVLKELLRLAYMRVKVYNAFARHVYPEWPMVVEWSMLNKMKNRSYVPVRCLAENPKKSIGQPIYKASCFLGGQYLPGTDGKLYLSVSEDYGVGSYAKHWQLVDENTYASAGMAIGKKMLERLDMAMRQSNTVDNELWHQLGSFGERVLKREGANKDAYDAWGGFGYDESMRKEDEREQQRVTGEMRRMAEFEDQDEDGDVLGAEMDVG